jgi:hypothetical protein
VGFLIWYYKQEYSPLYSVFIVLWGLVFVEWWRTRERILSVQWGSYRSSHVSKCRGEFRPERLEVDPVTGEEARVFPWWKREIRILSSLPALVGFSAGLSLLISAIYCVEVLINEVYEGPGKQYLVGFSFLVFLSQNIDVILAGFTSNNTFRRHSSPSCRNLAKGGHLANKLGESRDRECTRVLTHAQDVLYELHRGSWCLDPNRIRVL